jgi:hypothetical protein
LTTIIGRLLLWDEIQNLEAEIGNTVSAGEYTRVALVVAYALVNPRKFAPHTSEFMTDGRQVYVRWDAERFADKANLTRFLEENAVMKEMEKLGNYFQLGSLGFQSDPCTLVDIHGRILMWHLPEIMDKLRLVCGFIPGVSLSTMPLRMTITMR